MIGFFKCSCKFPKQMLCASETMRLEGDEQSARAQRAKRRQRRPNLRRVMAVIVENSKMRIREKFFLTPGRAAKAFKSASDFCRGKASLVQQRDDGGGVGYILPPDEPQRKIAESCSAMPDSKVRKRAGGSGIRVLDPRQFGRVRAGNGSV